MVNAAKAIAIQWLKKNLISKLPPKAFFNYPALEETLKHIEHVEDTLVTLPVRSLGYDQVLKIFNLTERHTEWTLEGHDMYQPSDLIIEMLKETDFVLEGSPKNAAYARCQLNNILISCVAEEKRLASAMAEKYSNPDPTKRLATPTTEPAELSLRFETALSYPVTYKHEKRMLNGIADYTLWYDNEDQMGTNLVVIEAKQVDTVKATFGQAVAYMGIVHACRLEAHERNSVVYCICSDGKSFRFGRIDNEGVLSQSLTFEWAFESNRSIITSYIRYIIRAAIASSPTTSPVKGKMREVTMGFFMDADRNKKFDFGIGNGESSEEDSDLEMEVLDLPDLPEDF